MAYIRPVRTLPITIAETPLFIRQASALWSDEERLEFVDFIARNPAVGDLVPAGHGIRKVRWSRQGQGKRGGVRVIYLYHGNDMPLYLLMIYAKARQEDLSPDARQAVQVLVERLKAARGTRGR